MRTRLHNLIPVLAFTSLLAGCGGAPSEREIEKAVKSQAEQEAQATKNLPFGWGAMMQVNITEVKKIGCKEDGEKAYRCDVELQVEQGGKSKKAPTSLRLVKGTDGWMVSR